MLSRVKRIFGKMEKSVDAIVLANGVEPHIDMSFFYVTGLDHGLFEGTVAIARPDGIKIITSMLEEESARHADAEVIVFKGRDERRALIRKALKGCKRIGLNPPELTHAWYGALEGICKGSKFVDVSKAIIDARLVKDSKEIATMREACKIASEAAEGIVDFIKPGLREYEVSAELAYMMQKDGASGPSFETIVAFAAMSAEPHYVAGNAKLKKGDFVLLDFGALYGKYRSDITRTYFMGRASAKQREMYDVVLEAQKAGIKKVKAGVMGSAVHLAAEGVINSSKYRNRMTHSVGHSIGLSVHDGGTLHPTVKQKLKSGMVFTVEPGVYLPGYGGVRIEDDVLVMPKGCEVLTTASKELTEL